MLSRQEGSMMWHLANTQYGTSLPVFAQDGFFARLVGWSEPTVLAIVHWVGY